MNKKILNRSENRVSFLYVEFARLEETEFSVQIIQKHKLVEIPISAINCILLGPGTTITHGAIKMLSDCGCAIQWCGQDSFYYYCSALPGTNSGKNILLQSKYHENNTLHMAVVYKMYSIRYAGENLTNKSLEELRGIEGKKVKELYNELASQYDIIWKGRSYNTSDLSTQDITNQCLTYCNKFLYAIIKSVINYLGFSPSLGFIHTGNIDSFVFDIADLYKEKSTIPCAFKVSSESQGDVYHSCRKELRKYIEEISLMKTIPKDLLALFPDADNLPTEICLWNYTNFIDSGKNYSN